MPPHTSSLRQRVTGAAKNRSVALKLFITFWLVYAMFATPAGGATPNRYVDLTHSIVNEGRFEIDTYHENTIDKAFVNGHYYAAALPGPSIMAAPLYVVFKEIYRLLPDSVTTQAAEIQSFKKTRLAGSSFYGSVDNVEFFFTQYLLTMVFVGGIGALGATVLFLFARQLGAGQGLALLTAIAYAWGTHAFFFSTTFFEQIITASLGIISFCGVHKFVASDERNPLSILALGALTGLLIFSEYFGAILAGLFFLYLAYHFRDRRAILFALGGLIPLFLLFAYNYLILGNLFDSPYLHLGAEFDCQIKEGLAGVSYPRPERALAVLFGIEKGLFLYAPILILSVTSMTSALAAPRRAAICLFCGAVFAVALIYNASFCFWSATSFGPKYLVDVLPMLTLPIAFTNRTGNLRRGLSWLLLGCSIFINWTGAQFGFAETVWEHTQTLFLRGATLPLFSALISHSSNASTIHVFVERYQPFLTSSAYILLLLVLGWIWKNERAQS